jgi:DNA-directed RNA polymerase specialized sigma24 family protein
MDPMMSRIVELRFFGGMSVEQTATFLALSAPTVKRHWQLAKVWLYQEISGG